LQRSATAPEALPAGAPPGDPELLRASCALGFFLPLLGGGNYFVFLDPYTALTVLALAVVGFVGRFWSREVSTPAAPQQMDMMLLAVFLVWWLGNFVTRPIGPHAAMDTGGLFCGALLYAALSRMSLGDEPVTGLAIGLAAGTLLTTIYAHYQYWIVIPGLQSWMPAHGLPSPYVAANANFYSANCYAPFLASVILLAIGVVWSRPMPRQQLFMYAVIPALAVALLLTKSRSSMGLMVVAFLGLILSMDRNRTRHIRLLSGIISLIGLVLAIALINFAELWSVSMPGRISIWHASLLMIRDHWLSGVGIGRFGEFFPNYQLTGYYTRYPHNLLLEVFAEVGIVGIVSFAGFIGLSLASLRWSTVMPDVRSFGRAALGLLLAHSLIDIDWRAPANPILFFLLLALCRR
jgi:O-antigen ligase